MAMDQTDNKPWRSWWVFYIDPSENYPMNGWKSAGNIAGPFTADEAITKTVGKIFDRPFWAFALDKKDFSSYYSLHYPEGKEPENHKKIGPSGYVAE